MWRQRAQAILGFVYLGAIVALICFALVAGLVQILQGEAEVGSSEISVLTATMARRLADSLQKFFK